MSDNTYQEQLEAAVNPLHELLQKQDAEIKTYGETSKELRGEIKKAEGRYNDLEKQLKEKTDELHVKLNRPQYAPAMQSRKTAGSIFVDSEEFKNPAASRNFETGAVDVGNLFGSKTIANATIGDDGTTGNAPVVPTFAPELYYDPGQRELTIRDIMNVAPTTSNQIVYYREQGDFDAGTASAQNGETDTKQQMQMNFDMQSAPVVTIAAWLPASRQVLDDRTELQSHIDSRLRYKVLKEMEDQVIFGDGVNGAMVGIHNTAGVQTIGAPEGTDSIIDHLRKAFAAVRVGEYNATGVILHPNDWAEIELTKGSDNHYIWVSVPDGGQPRLWRVPVVESTVMQEGRFLTGAFGQGAQLWDRQQASVRVSEHHGTYFVRNAVAILAEVRVGLAVYRPQAFIRGVFDASVST